MNNASSSGSTSSSTQSTTGGIITIDSDEEADDGRAAGSKAKSTKRKRASNGSSDGEVLDLLDSEEEKAVKRSRTRKAQSRADRNSGAGGSRVTRSMQLDDVIVVEDD